MEKTRNKQRGDESLVLEPVQCRVHGAERHTSRAGQRVDGLVNRGAKPLIEQLAERPDLLPTVAARIYNEWWAEVDGADVGKLTGLLRAHLVLDQMPLSLVASLERSPVGTATLLAHDVDTEEWPDLSPWLAAVYVAPEYRHRGIGSVLVNAIVAQATALGVGTLYLATLEREEWYARLGWQIVDRREDKIVMSKSRGSSP